MKMACVNQACAGRLNYGQYVQSSGFCPACRAKLTPDELAELKQARHTSAAAERVKAAQLARLLPGRG